MSAPVAAIAEPPSQHSSSGPRSPATPRRLAGTAGALSGPDRSVIASGQRWWSLTEPAELLPLLIDEHPETTSFAEVGATAGRGLQGRTSAAHVTGQGDALQAQHPAAAPRHAADLLRPHHRMGLARRPGPPRSSERHPRPDEPLPKFLDDGDGHPLRPVGGRRARSPAAARARAAHAHGHAGRRAVCARARRRGADRRGLVARVPVGKLHNDRYVPLHPHASRRCSTPGGRTHDDGDRAPAHQRRTASQPPRGDPHGQPGRADGRASATSTPTSCATPWPPRRSTGACASRPSPRSSGTGPCA